MRVALLSFYASDTTRIAGGIRMVAFNLVNGLRALDDLDLHVVHCHSDIEPSQERSVEDDGVTLHYLALPKRRLVPNLVRGVRRVVDVLHRLNPDVVHAHAAHFAYAGVRSGYPTVYTIHGILPYERKVYCRTLFDRLRYGLLDLYERRALAQIRVAVAISPYVRDAYAGRVSEGLGGSRWVRINNPVPDEFFALKDKSEPGRILYVGSITEVKDLLTLLRAHRRLCALSAGGATPQLCIAGRATSADYDRRVRAFVHEHALDDRVTFMGLLTRERLLREYARASVVALPSLRENAPMAIIEAMAAAKPVVATRVGGVPDLVEDGATGFMVDAGDDEGMSQRLAQIIGDRALARAFGQRARHDARERFGADQVAAEYHALYRRVADGGWA